MRNQWIFRLITLFLPLLFLIAVEYGLRLLSIGESKPLFIDNPTHPDYILPRPDILKRYFPANAPVPSVTLEANFLLKHKPKDGIRIFVQGGSTAAGYPYGLGASLAGMLDHRLKRSLPNHYVEVINTAMSAVNSFTLLDLADEIIQQQPDAVLIYAGHNEYLGILGVGSSFTLGSSYWLTRSMLWLKDLHIYQLIQNTIYALSNHTDKNLLVSQTQRRTVMSQVAKHKDIVYQSDLFDAGITQFERNLHALLAKYRSANVPVFIATIASNQRHHSPFNSMPVSDEFKIQLTRADTPQKLAALASRLQPNLSADLHFSLAEQLFEQGQATLAKQHFALAKDYDLLRFRAPEAINQVIRDTASENSVYLADVNRRMQQRSEAGIIGNNLMLEHLHPNVQGYFLLADTFYQSLLNSQIFKPFIEVDINQAWRARPLLPAEEYYGFASVLTLMSDYPFTDSPKPVALPAPSDWQQELGKQRFTKQIDWLTMLQKSAERYRLNDQPEMWLKSLQIIADALPHDPLANVRVAELLGHKKRYSESKYYLQRAKRAGAVDNTLDEQIRFAKQAAEIE